MQGHTGETTSELQLLKQVYPGHSRPGSVWNAAGILGNKVCDMDLYTKLAVHEIEIHDFIT